jgi:2-polyprenyl-6-methoxyphenol hydroxylase-like FAD-dependent oxidoreductase
VVNYFENGDDGKAGVVLKDGSRHEADLVVAADGVRGNSWPLVAGHPVPARSSGHAIFRVAYPVENALADPMIAERFPLLEDGRSVIEMWVV